MKRQNSLIADINLTTRSGRARYMKQFLPNLPKSPYAALASETGYSEIFIRKFFIGEFKITHKHKVLAAVTKLIAKTKADRAKELQELAAIAFSINETAAKNKSKK